jgi:radical SAM protein with 4Fe4S-binding SPASM domain
MTHEVFQHVVRETREAAEYMMLIGLGEPFMDPAIFDRI